MCKWIKSLKKLIEKKPRTCPDNQTRNVPLRIYHTVGLNMYETLMKMLEQAEHIFDTFEYF